MHRKEVTHSDGSYEKKSRRRTWLKKWDKVKIPWYTHRLMHLKRVTCELQDSYFRLMTINHAIPKILSGRLNYYITRGRREVSELGTREFGDKMWLRKPSPSGRGLWDPRLSLEARPVREKMLEWEHVLERLGPQAPVEQSRRTRTTHGDPWRGWGGQCVAVFVQSPTPSHMQPYK